MLDDKKVVYFNHWFSSMECLISDLKSRYGDDIVIIASSENDYVTYKNVADYFINAEDTPELWIDTCKKYKVDIFFCRDKDNKADTSVANKLTEMGVDVILDKNRLLDDKAAFYELVESKTSFKDFPDIVVPMYYTFYSCEDNSDVVAFMYDVITYLASKKKTTTLKLINDEGGASFRVVDACKSVDFESLSHPTGRGISYGDLHNLFKNMTVEQAREIMLMEKLAEPEISLDCYNSKSAGFLAYGREKLGRHQKIVDCQQTTDTEYIEMRKFALGVAENFRLKNPFNIQFMKVEDTGLIAILEVNTRLSGGCYMLTPLGVNMCDIVIKDRLGETLSDADIKFNTGETVAYVARTEKPVVV